MWVEITGPRSLLNSSTTFNFSCTRPERTLASSSASAWPMATWQGLPRYLGAQFRQALHSFAAGAHSL